MIRILIKITIDILKNMIYSRLFLSIFKGYIYLQKVCRFLQTILV